MLILCIYGIFLFVGVLFGRFNVVWYFLMYNLIRFVFFEIVVLNFDSIFFIVLNFELIIGYMIVIGDNFWMLK